MSAQHNKPSLYQLANDEIQITFIPCSYDGLPELDYLGPHGSCTFTGDQIGVEETMINTLISICLAQTADSGSVTLTLQLPNVILEGITAQAIKALAIVTNDAISRDMQNRNQDYQAYDLQGVARPTVTDPIELCVNASLYFGEETISVTLSNRSNHVIFFPDHQTNCTVIRLQRQVDEIWEDVNLCNHVIAKRLHHLDTGESYTIEFDPLSFIVGRYRATLHYATSRQSSPQRFIQSRWFGIK